MDMLVSPLTSIATVGGIACMLFGKGGSRRHDSAQSSFGNDWHDGEGKYCDDLVPDRAEISGE